MPIISSVEAHPDMALIDHGMANQASLASLSRRFGVSITALCRRRQKLRDSRPEYLAALKQTQPSMDEIARRHAEACAGLRELEKRKSKNA